jgi:hypothetical protein
VHAIRAFLRTNRRLALGLVVLALVIKALVPAGYMLGGPLGDKAHVLTIAICGDASGGPLTQQIVVPSDGKSGDHAKAEGTGGRQCSRRGAAGPGAGVHPRARSRADPPGAAFARLVSAPAIARPPGLRLTA